MRKWLLQQSCKKSRRPRGVDVAEWVQSGMHQDLKASEEDRVGASASQSLVLGDYYDGCQAKITMLQKTAGDAARVVSPQHGLQ